MRDHHTTGGRWSPAETKKHTNELELALCSLCNNVRNKHIRTLSDNTTTVCYLNNMDGSKSRACNIIAKKIWQFVLERNNFLYKFSTFARYAKYVSHRPECYCLSRHKLAVPSFSMRGIIMLRFNFRISDCSRQ